MLDVSAEAGGGISPAFVLGFCTTAEALHFVLSGSAHSKGEGSGEVVVMVLYSEGHTTYLVQSVSSPDIGYRFHPFRGSDMAHFRSAGHLVRCGRSKIGKLDRGIMGCSTVT